MSLDKAELKKLIYQEVGSKLEDVLEASQKNQVINEGGKLALRQACKTLQGLATIADQELTEGKIKDIETLAVVKLYVTRAVTAVDNLARYFENLELSAGGGVVTGTRMVSFIKKMYDEEVTKVAAHTELAQTGVSSRRLTGIRPSKSIAEQRRAEDRAEEKKRKKDAANAGQG